MLRIFLEFKQLTTNLTGHFALFINDVSNFQVWKGLVYFLYIYSFLLGSFLSSFLLEEIREKRRQNVFVCPTFIVIFLLIAIPVVYKFYPIGNSDWLVCSLLFAMGLQNSFVTQISNAVVRTTHLTGLFTDLGIELLQLFFPKAYQQRDRLQKPIKLCILIISYFFLGGFAEGHLYSKMELKLNTLFFAATLLLFSLLFNDIKFIMIKAKRKFRQTKGEAESQGKLPTYLYSGIA